MDIVCNLLFGACNFITMAEQDSVKSLMNPRVISVLPDTPIKTAIDILLSNNFNGIPVTDKNGAIVGILTKYDIIIHRESVRDDTKVRDLMNNDPLVLTENMTVEDAVRVFTEHHKVDPIPVIDQDKKVIGIISRYDMVRMFREYGVNFETKDSKPAIGRNSNIGRWLLLAMLALIAGIVYYFFF